MQVSDNRGRIIEENHYYAFGLKIAGISSRKLGDFNEGLLDNKNLYNDKELIDEADLNWYDYGFRNYDPQIGRFPQLDLLTDDYTELTPFQYGSNDPIANIDVDGLEGTSIINGMVHGAVEPGGQALNLGSKAMSIASMTVNAAKVLTTLDGQKSLSSDVEKRLRVNQVKEINKRWIPQGSNKSINEITGQIRYSTTAVESLEVVGTILVPIPKVGWALKLLGRGAEVGVETGVDVGIKAGAKETEQFLLEASEFMNKHHIFPDEFRPWFKSRGISIDKWTVQVSEKLHLRVLHKGARGGVWNERWLKFISENPKANPSQIFKFGEDLLHEFGLEHLRYVKYR